VVSFGGLGILGRNGLFCREADVERWNALAGWRGLKDPAVRDHFNGTVLAFFADWWSPEPFLKKMDLHYDVAYLLGAAEVVIRARLDAGLPALFSLWSPHAFVERYRLTRIELPAYNPALFGRGASDFPIDVVEKVAWKQLAYLVPAVAEFYSRFRIDNSAQESMLAKIDAEGVSVMEAACAWIRQEENAAALGTWLSVPVAGAEGCVAGNYALNATSCEPCLPGSASIGGVAAKCVQCSAGTKDLPNPWVDSLSVCGWLPHTD
jgi:hypothetical protein